MKTAEAGGTTETGSTTYGVITYYYYLQFAGPAREWSVRLPPVETPACHTAAEDFGLQRMYSSHISANTRYGVDNEVMDFLILTLPEKQNSCPFLFS